MADVKNIILVGATGNIGPIFVKILSQHFNVSILTRNGSSKEGVSPDATILEADYNSIDSLADALRGQDAVVSLVGGPGIAWQEKLVEASIQAGVKRFVPSEFGSDLSNENAAQLPFYESKIAFRKFLESKGKEISWDAMISGPFLDFGLLVGLFGFDLTKRTAVIFDGGNAQFNTTLISATAEALSTVLQRPATNGYVKFKSTTTTQSELFEAIKEAIGSEGWTVTEAKIADTQQEYQDKLKEGVDFHAVIVPMLRTAFFAPGFGAVHEDVNEELGLALLDKEGLVTAVKDVAKKLGL